MFEYTDKATGMIQVIGSKFSSVQRAIIFRSENMVGGSVIINKQRHGPVHPLALHGDGLRPRGKSKLVELQMVCDDIDRECTNDLRMIAQPSQIPLRRQPIQMREYGTGAITRP